MTTLNAVKCPICLDLYSSARHPVCSPKCGHSLCKPCADTCNTNKCSVCTQKSFHVVNKRLVPWPSSEWSKNYTVLEMIEKREEHRKLVEEQSKLLGEQAACSECKSMERKEKLKICETCVSAQDIDWKVLDTEKILPFVLCAFCCVEKHMNHRWETFGAFKETLLSTVADGKVITADKHNLCVVDINNTKKAMDKWSRIEPKFRNHQDGVTMVNRLKREVDRVAEECDECLPKLAKYRKVMEESTANLFEMQAECIQAGAVYVEKVPFVQPTGTAVFDNFKILKVDHVLLKVSRPVRLTGFRFYDTATRSAQPFPDSENVSKAKVGIFKNSFDGERAREGGDDWLVRDDATNTVNMFMQPAVKLLPDVEYVMKMNVDAETELSWGACNPQDSTYQIALPGVPEITVTLCELVAKSRDADDRHEMFAGFYFSA